MCLLSSLLTLNRLRQAVPFAAALIVIFSSLLLGAEEKDMKDYKIVTTIAQLAEPLSLIAGDCAQVENLLGSGTDPHLYRLTRADVLKMRKADMIFYVGHLLEAQMAHLLDELGETKVVYAVGEMVDEQALLEVAPGVYDPHLWMDPLVWREVLDLAVGRIIAAVPSCRAIIETNSKDYFTWLRGLDSRIRFSLRQVPDDQRILVTSHDAFGYFGRSYDIEVLAIQGLSTDRQVSVRKINDLVDQLIEKEINTVFIESSVSARDMNAVIEGAASREHYIRLGGILFSDAMGAEGTKEGTYIGMLMHNAQLIASSFGIKLADLSDL